jgi:molybdopterin/thiamine biosynthesis adenylyltransferase/rhodanese-related sulfurtransferase
MRSNSSPPGRDDGAEDFVRYSRQIMLPGFGEAGQQRLGQTSALIVGLGGLGSPAALYLAAAGIGTLGLLDSDAVELSNLHRQPLHNSERFGWRKTESAAATLRALNPRVRLQLHDIRLTSQNARDIMERYDIVLDASDNFETRYTTNDTCAALAKPFVYGSIFRFEGEVSLFDPRTGPCYRCLYPEPPPPDLVPDCSQAGVLGVLPGVIGMLQAVEVIKYAAGIGRPLIGRLLRVDALSMTFREICFDRDPECRACAKPAPGAIADVRGAASSAAPVTCAAEAEITPEELKAALTHEHPLFLLDVRERVEHAFCHIAGSMLIPLGQLEQRLEELPKDRPIVVYCRSGCRGAAAVQLLKGRGFGHAKNLAGGILAWAERIDPTLPRY